MFTRHQKFVRQSQVRIEGFHGIWYITRLAKKKNLVDGGLNREDTRTIHGCTRTKRFPKVLEHRRTKNMQTTAGVPNTGNPAQKSYP
jgi:hypothetical protein